MPEQAKTAADWLLAEFDATDVNQLAVFDEDTDAWVWPPCVQPMFTIKPDMDSGAEMSVRPADYKDPERWWL